jgi:hypothetical protein
MLEFNDSNIRDMLRTWRMEHGREPSVIYMPISVHHGYVNFLSTVMGWTGMDRSTMYGVPIIIWGKDEIVLEDLRPTVLWDSGWS